MKNTIKLMGLITLICFSFFYTEKVITVINEYDDLMIILNEVDDSYLVNAIDAITTEKTIIPGISGKKVNVEKSYQNMKQLGIFDENYIIYDVIKPNNLLENNYDKYIIKGNSSKNMVSLVFIVNNNIDNLLKVINETNISVNLFVDYDYLYNNLNTIKDSIKKYSIYSYGLNGQYDNEVVILSNNLINRVFKNNKNYCLAIVENENTLDICSNNNISTIIPSINGGYNEIKNTLENGSIIYLNNTVKTINELKVIVNYIMGKGMKIVDLDTLLNEKN